MVRKEISTDGYELSPFHGLDHAFIFSSGYSSNFHIKPYAKRDLAMSKLMVTLITNFVKDGDPSTKNFEWPSYTNTTEHYASLDLPPRLIRGAVHFPASNFWNNEARMLAKYTLSDSPQSENEVISDLSAEERLQVNKLLELIKSLLQLSAYRRAWVALWLFVISVAILIWILVICFVFHKGRSPVSAPYNNLIINR